MDELIDLNLIDLDPRDFLIVKVEPGDRRGKRECVMVNRADYLVGSVPVGQPCDAPQWVESVEDWLKREPA